VVKLQKPDRIFDGTLGVSRTPLCGDIGAICLIHTPGKVLVEVVNDDGIPVWLADFEAEELELE
jgi:hypothetical protein